MNLWNLEWLRMWRTQRWLILVAVYGVFGALGPLTARYLPELLESIDESAVSSLPPMTAEDGIVQYIGNAAQIGLLAVAFVGAAAIAFDANHEMSIFLRTRATVRSIFVPRFVVVSATAVAAFLFGMAIAYIGTGLLLAWLDVGPVVMGSLLHALYLVFVVAVIGLVSSFVRKVPGVALLSVGILIAIALPSLVPSLAPWLPDELIGATEILIRGGSFDFWRSIIVTVLLIVGMIALSVYRLERREL
ncbi:MAG: hypothetical protein ACR2N9_00705 [Acidimicrobiia bacterium]